MYIICAWDYNIVYGYFCKDTNGDYMFADRESAVKYETKQDAQNAIEKLKKSVFSKLTFCVEQFKGE